MKNLVLKFRKIILDGPDTDLKLTKKHSASNFDYKLFDIQSASKRIKFRFKKIKYFIGHSLGEYSALVCANSLKFEDALYLLHERGKAMQEAVPVGEGSMLAVLGVKIDDVQNYLSKLSKNKICEIANDNADGQIILSGKKMQ